LRGESPKALRIYFRHDQKLFASVSSLIFSLIRQFYRLAAGSPLLRTACAIAFQPFGDFLRANAHWHAIILEGGFGPDGKFLFLPIHDTQKLTEAFRRAVIKLLMSRSLITEEFASTLLCWKNSGFSVNHQVRIPGEDHKTRAALAQYIARAPLSLAKLFYLPAQATVRYSSAFNPAIGDSRKVWNARDFIADATSFIPPQGVRLIHYFGLYASRSRRCSGPPQGWKWPQWDHVVRHAPQGWKKAQGVTATESSPQPSSPSVPESSCRSLGRQPFRKKRREPAWARLIAKVYEIDLIGGSPCPAGALARREGVCAANSESPLVCTRCSSKMRVLAVITNPAEVKKTLRHLIKIGCPPPGRQPSQPEHGTPCGGETAGAPRLGSRCTELIRPLLSVSPISVRGRKPLGSST
jgi:hypothetical protein